MAADSNSNMKLRHPLSLRLFHWVNAISIVMLTLTGFVIHDPIGFRMFSGNMDTSRYLHFIFMYILIFSTIGRIWYMIIAKDYRNILFYRWQDVKDMGSLILYYLFLKNTHPDYGKYNPGQKLMYTLVFIMIIIQVITGFILYMPTALNGWAMALGGFIVVRLIHYCITWLFILCVMVHVYLDLAEGMPVLMSMINGKIPKDFHAHIKIPRPQTDASAGNE